MNDFWLGLFIGALAMFIVMLLVVAWACVGSYQLGLREAHLPPEQRTIKVMSGEHDRSRVALRGFMVSRLSPNRYKTPQKNPKPKLDEKSC